MKRHVRLALLLLAGASLCARAGDAAPGADLDGLLAYARTHNPEIAGMRYEAEAAAARIEPAGALPDPRLRTEWMDTTKYGEQAPTVLPARVGSTRYTLTQELPWFGKRQLRQAITEFEAEGARGRSASAWAELAARIKTLYAQRYAAHRSAVLTQEILGLMVQLEKVAQIRYAGGLAPQQDVIRAQVEQTGLRNELLALDSEQRSLVARLNGWLARPASAPLATPESLRPLPAPARLDPQALEERLRARNPLLAVEGARLQAAEKTRALTYKNRYPDFTVGIAPSQYQSSLKTWDLMVEFNIPLQQGSRRAQERESEAMLAAARTRKEAAANQTLADLAENLAGLDSARRTAILIETGLLPQAELTFQAALAGYENGKIDFATLLDAQRQIRIARQSQLRAQTEAQARLAEIERLVGDDL